MTDSATLTPPAAPEAARLLDPLEHLIDVPHRSGPSDGQLLDRFILHGDHQAFASLVQRHGAMVLGVCRRVVGNCHDADDAFQATFLVLVRRADSIRPREMVGPWLHGVACRTASVARQRVTRRLAREKSLGEVHELASMTPAAVEGWPELDHAIHRLPEIYRRPVVLCELQGTPRREAARLLGVAEGTLSSRLASARKRLARQLRKRGVLNTVIVSSLANFPQSASAQVPPALTASTFRGVKEALTTPGATNLPSAVLQLSQGAMRSMFFSKCKSLVATAVLVGCLGGGAVLLAGPVDNVSPDTQQDRPGRGQDKRKPGAAKADDKHKHTNRETIEGSGNIITETRKISGVSSITFTTAGTITIKQTGRESLTIKGDDNILALIDSKIEDAGLTLGLNRKDVNLKPSQKVEFIIEVKSLSQFEQKGAADVTISQFNGQELTVNILGAGDVKLDGKAGSVKLLLNGAGNIHAEKFDVRDAVVELNGAGSVHVNATNTLDASINGAGDIEYRGEPKVKKSVRGVGKVRPAQEGKSTIKT